MNIDLKQFAKPRIIQRSFEHDGATGDVGIRELSVSESNSVFALIEAKQTLKARKRLLALSVMDASGKPQFSEDEIGEMPAGLAAKLEKLALSVNGMDAEGAAAAKNA